MIDEGGSMKQERRTDVFGWEKEALETVAHGLNHLQKIRSVQAQLRNREEIVRTCNVHISYIVAK